MRLYRLADRYIADMLDFARFLVKGSIQLHDLSGAGVYTSFIVVSLISNSKNAVFFDVSHVVLFLNNDKSLSVSRQRRRRLA